MLIIYVIILKSLFSFHLALHILLPAHKIALHKISYGLVYGLFSCLFLSIYTCFLLTQFITDV